MCGIAGFIDYTRYSGSDQLMKMQRTLIHRGPDSQGHKLVTEERAVIGLAHTRLSIIDTSALGQQPMFFEQYTIVLNGEVYNYREIRKVLEGLGHSFTSTSDTEVVLHAFAEWNTRCVEKFVGMFAFCIYDKKTNKLYLCRDRVGVKPLFYYWKNGLFLFGSEIKAFHAHEKFEKNIRNDALTLFLRYGYVPGPMSIFENVYKLEPAHWLVFDVGDSCFTGELYWDIEAYYKKPAFNISFEQATHELEELLLSACQYRMVSDVPIGLFLSGGFDSTLVAALLQRNSSSSLKTFTIGFPDGVNEAPFAEAIANHLGTDHLTYHCTETDAKEILPELSYYYDEPCADISAIPTILVSRQAGRKVKVALSADGGDELFAGYSGFKTLVSQLDSIRKIPIPQLSRHSLELANYFIPNNRYSIKRKINEVISVLNAPAEQQLRVLLEKSSGIPPALLNDILLSPMDQDKNSAMNAVNGSSDYRNLLFINSIKRTLKDLLLVKVDRASMSASIESREPLLDHRLIEYSAQLPFHFKHDGKTSKRIVREIVYKYVPQPLMDRPKTGFDLPIFKWLKGDMKYLIDQYLDCGNPVLRQFFDPGAVNRLVTDFRNDKLVYKDIVWRILTFLMWHQRWCKE